ncbi:Glucose--fructose oxidoreductase precursor [Symmachiella macrocystis]|uniref:Glucose--fructose oxidoreductase n=1 Tax=Symmachiella macrocystis TaxID=2527985 RepID=A0A5C6BAZ8_9PLAN|nr:Gfo/Idh/MocA family oxidoreductase [Symmachiella macrocystis]TWU09263.1 Glucose--fructose oxidoreductase precursor [Symmachiella macrocystis]
MSATNRRGFLKSSAAVATNTAAAAVLMSEAQAAKAPANERLRVGCIGTGGRAQFLITAFAGLAECDVVTVCDLDPERLSRGVEVVKIAQGHPPKAETDFLKLIDDPTLDVIVVGTPDHWHAIPTIMACQAGKDVYVEKPDGHNMVEGQRMVQAMRKHGRIVQMGTQARTGEHFQAAIDYIATGALGKVLVAKAWESTRQSSLGHPQDSSPPAGIDYDRWLGPAPKRPFNKMRFHANWRWFFELGAGDLGNDGVHRLDYARWALSTAVEAQGGKPLHMPTKISALGGKWYFDDIQEWPDTLQVNYEYPGEEDGPGKILTYEMRVWTPYNHEGEGEGAVIYGDQGYIVIGNRRWRAYGPKHKLLAEHSGNNDGLSHIQNFVDCIKSRKKPNADLETVGHPSSILCHAGNIAWRVGRQVQLDPETETFIDDDEANALRTRPEYRKPWELPVV